MASSRVPGRSRGCSRESASGRPMWRTLRIAILLVVLAIVAGGAWLDRQRTTSWEHTVWVGAFPVNADGSAAAADYISRPRRRAAATGRRFHRARSAPLRRRARCADRDQALSAVGGAAAATRRRCRAVRPHRVGRCGCATTARRPSTASSARGRRSRCSCCTTTRRASPVLPHSLGLQRGLMGVVHLFATRSADGAECDRDRA